MAEHQLKVLSQLREERDFSEKIFEKSGLQYLRGSITEIAGSDSSGKTALIIAALGELTRNGEVCAIVDISNSFDPETALLNGLILENILWIKCGGELENGFLITDYLVQAKGFGAIWLNLNFVTREQIRLIPSSYWFRFRTGIRGCPTILIVTSKKSILGSASKKSYQIKKRMVIWNGIGRFKLFRDFIVDQTPQKGNLQGSAKTNRISMVYEDV